MFWKYWLESWAVGIPDGGEESCERGKGLERAPATLRQVCAELGHLSVFKIILK